MATIRYAPAYVVDIGQAGASITSESYGSGVRKVCKGPCLARGNAPELKGVAGAFAVDLAIYAASTAFSVLFLEALDSICTVEDTRTVQLPNLGRSVKDQYIDTMATEVDSHQPCPEEEGPLATGQHQ